MARAPEAKAFGISPYKVHARRQGAQLFSKGLGYQVVALGK
jgi:hypothetical protein